MHQKIYALNYSILLVCFPLLSCGGGSSGNETLDLSASANESIFLARTVAVPEGATCAEGGFQVKSGEDKNKDGELADGEIFKEDIFCNGKSILPDIPLIYGPPIFSAEQIFDGQKFTCESTEYDDESTTCYRPAVNGFPVFESSLGETISFCLDNGFGFLKGSGVVWADVSTVGKFYRWHEGFSAYRPAGWTISSSEKREGFLFLRSNNIFHKSLVAESGPEIYAPLFFRKA